MLQKKGGRGFPHCIVMDSSGTVMKELRPSSESAFVGGMSMINLLFKARAAVNDDSLSKSKKKTAQMNLDLLEAVFNPDESKFKELMKVAKKKRISKEARDAFVGMVKIWPIRKECEKAEKALAKMRDRAGRAKVTKERDAALYDIFLEKGTKVEDSGSDYFDTFWMAIANHSLVMDDKKRGMQAVDLLLKKYEGNRRATDYFKGLQRKLEKL